MLKSASWGECIQTSDCPECRFKSPCVFFGDRPCSSTWLFASQMPCPPSHIVHHCASNPLSIATISSARTTRPPTERTALTGNPTTDNQQIEEGREMNGWNVRIVKAEIDVDVYPASTYAFPSFFFCLRGGVTGRPMFMPPYGYFAFFSAGFRIWIRLMLTTKMETWNSNVLGRSTVESHQRSSWHPRYRILHSNSARRKVWPSVVLQRIHNRPRRPRKPTFQ